MVYLRTGFVTGISLVVLVLLPLAAAQNEVQDSLGSAVELTYYGCWIDDPVRDLPHNAIMNDANMSLQKCYENCQGYDYLGLQYSVECFCGNFPYTHGSAPESQCSAPCSGEPGRMCGATWRQSIYSTKQVTIECPMLDLPNYGYYVNDECATEDLPVGYECAVTCHPGSVREGPHTLTCGDNGSWDGAHSCEIQEPCTCYMRGDPAARPCDGDWRLVLAAGTYSMFDISAPCNLKVWATLTGKENPDNRMFLTSATIIFGGDTIIIKDNGNVFVNGPIIPGNGFPFSGPGYEITRDGKWVVVTIPGCDFEIRFHGRALTSVLKITAPAAAAPYANSGMCGDYNGHVEDYIDINGNIIENIETPHLYKKAAERFLVLFK